MAVLMESMQAWSIWLSSPVLYHAVPLPYPNLYAYERGSNTDYDRWVIPWE